MATQNNAATGDTAVAISIGFTVAAGIVLCLRCYSRFVMLRKAGADDLFIVLSFLGSISLTCAIGVEKHYGLGKDVFQLPHHDVVEAAKYVWIGSMAYWMGLTFVKLSALTQYLRFVFLRKFRIACWTAIILCASCGIAGVFSSIFACRPISYIWDRSIEGGKCIDYVAWVYFASAWTIITDVVVVVIPILAFKDLNMPKRQKRALIFLFALGAVGCIASILRITAVYIATTGWNFTEEGSCMAWWSSIEINVGIICISIPSIKPIFVKYWPRSRTTTCNSSGKQLLSGSTMVSTQTGSFTENGSVDSDIVKSKDIEAGHANS